MPDGLTVPRWALDVVPWTVDHTMSGHHDCPCRPVCVERTVENYERRFWVVGGDPFAVAHRQSYVDAVGRPHLLLHLEEMPDALWESLRG